MQGYIAAILFALPFNLFGHSADSTELLISDMNVQIESTEAMDAMYNFDFDKAARQYRWLQQKYPHSPLPYFLLGLNEWWKMLPNENNTSYDEAFHHYMDTTIMIAKPMLKKEETRIEGAFFLAATYGFKGRLYADRRSWGKAASAGKNALKYLEISKKESNLSPELMFGDALYNYFSVWIPENYPLLKPLFIFFKKGDKKLGLQQLEEVSNNAFYTRIEARIFLMRILSEEENNYRKALQIARYLHEHYPHNPYFHRYYVRYLYSLHLFRTMEPEAHSILQRIDSGYVGYEASSGRYAAFFLGQMYQSRGKLDEAQQYYEKVIDYARVIDAMKSGYTLYALLNLGKIARENGYPSEARRYFKQVKKLASRKHPAYKEAKVNLKRKKKNK